MATKLYCDKCGKGQSEKRPLVINKITVNINNKYRLTRDICIKCIDVKSIKIVYQNTILTQEEKTSETKLLEIFRDIIIEEVDNYNDNV